MPKQNLKKKNMQKPIYCNFNCLFSARLLQYRKTKFIDVVEYYTSGYSVGRALFKQ